MSIASNLKAQLVGQFIAALGNGSPLEVQKGAAALTAALAELQTGQTIVATVAGNALNGKLPIIVNGASLFAEVSGAALPPDALKPGAVLQLKVETTGNTPRLTFQTVEPQSSTTGTNTKPTLTSTPAIAATQAPEVRIITPQIPALNAPTAFPRSPLEQAVAVASSEAASRQGSAAPLYADLAALLARPDNGLPQPILRIAAALLNSRLNGEAPVSTNDVKQAIKASGIFHETFAQQSLTPPLDAKALLVALREALRSEGSLPSSRNTPDQEPPRRDAPVTAHKSVTASISDETDSQKIVTTLARESEQAVERIKLHQIASLPERLAAPDAMQTRQYNFEIPIALGQQTAMAGFRVEQEKKRNAKLGEPTDVWGIRFAIDADILGAVHAHLRLSGNSISVSLWAEDPATHRFFVQAMPLLEAALTENALDIGELIAFSGKPAEARQANAGHFLDKRS